jgi:prepilin-type N-terminal cleavage/methylation domain-containing protein
MREMKRLYAADGFTLLELMVVIAITGILLGSTVMVASSVMSQSRADAATVAVVNTLSQARTRALTERRNFQVNFIMPNRIQVARVELTGGTPTVVSDTLLENGYRFERFTALPDTPDKFGATDAISFGLSPTRAFTSEGALVDAGGDVLNGSIFLARNGESSSARAVTVFGVTGLIRGWKWTGHEWAE